MNRTPPQDPAQASSCWLRGCLILAMVVPTVLFLVLVWMILSRLGAPA